MNIIYAIKKKHCGAAENHILQTCLFEGDPNKNKTLLSLT